MKIAVILLLAGVVLSQGEDFNSDFAQGMENGFFLREDLQAYKDYDCPDLNHNEKWQGAINQVFAPIKLILSMFDNKMFNSFWELVEVLVPSMADLSATVNGYTGSEYCSGMMFGMHGSSLLIRVAK